MAKLKIFVSIIFAVLYLNVSALAEMYKWVDENGVTHFSDTPPAKPAPSTTIKAFPTYDSPYKNTGCHKPKTMNTVQRSQTPPSKMKTRNTVQGPETTSFKPKTRNTVQSSEATPSTIEKPKKHKKPEVELYVTNWCPWCNKASYVASLVML